MPTEKYSLGIDTEHGRLIYDYPNIFYITYRPETDIGRHRFCDVPVTVRYMKVKSLLGCNAV
jgi:hypothetical protein